tara:strand:+ start:64 stop:342 length:279 start_codon:yes stop_codon:yes gene_type:complete
MIGGTHPQHRKLSVLSARLIAAQNEHHSENYPRPSEHSFDPLEAKQTAKDSSLGSIRLQKIRPKSILPIIFFSLAIISGDRKSWPLKSGDIA